MLLVGSKVTISYSLEVFFGLAELNSNQAQMLPTALPTFPITLSIPRLKL